MTTKHDLEAMRNRLEAAVTEYQRQVKRLYREDGKPIFSDAEMKTQMAALRPPYLELTGTAKTLATSARQTASQLADAATIDPFAKLPGPDLERAFYLRPFVERDVERAEAGDLAARLRAVAAGKDRPLQLLYADHAAARLTPGNGKASGGGSLELIKAMQTLQGALTPVDESEADIMRTLSTQLTMLASEAESIFDGSRAASTSDLYGEL